MALMNYKFNYLQDLFIMQLKDLYDAEQQLTKALPKMSQAAMSLDLKNAFNEHLEQTKGHVRRLEDVFRELNCPAERENCAAMSGIIKEGGDIINAKGNDSVRDAGLIAAGQRAEHYEIAGYGTVRSFAQRLGLENITKTLQQTLDEEEQTDKKLTGLAETQINAAATLYA